MQYEQKQFQQENEEKTQNTKNQNISADLLKEFFKKKEVQKQEGFESIPLIQTTAKKGFLSDAQVKDVISEMQQQTTISVDKLRMQQYYEITACDLAQFQQNEVLDSENKSS